MIRDVEILVVGAGPAGLCAAKTAANYGAQVLLCERDEIPGGQLVKQTHKFFGSEKQFAGDRGFMIGRMLVKEVLENKNITLWTDTTVLGAYEDGIITCLHEGEHVKIRAKKTVICTGAAEKFLTFPGNDLPGIYGAGAVQTLMNVAGVKPAEKVVMVGAGNIGLIVSYQLTQAGVQVVKLVEAAPKIGGYLVHASKLRRAGVPILTGYTIKEAYGKEQLEGVIIQQLDEKWQPVPGTEEDVLCDTLCLAVGLSPLTELLWQAGCDMAYIRELSGHVPLLNDCLETTKSGIYAAGDARGIEEASAAMVEGRLAGAHAAMTLGCRAEEAAKEVEAAKADLSELRSGPTGAKILTGIKKMQETKEAMNNAQ